MIAFRFYGITDRSQCPRPSMVEHIEEACASGLRALQLRERDLDAGDLFELAQEIRKVTLAYGTLLFINDRVDIAMAVGADGVHGRETSLPPDEIKSLNEELLVGASVHSVDSAKEAEERRADFLVFGPVYPTDSKENPVEARGLAALSAVTGAVEIPVYAVGGITPANASVCLEHGAFGVAGISSLMKARDVAGQMRTFQQKLSAL